jgi:DNA polymerase-2
MALFSALEQWFWRHDPDLVIGWNVVNGDCRHLLRRAELNKRRLRLGRGREGCFWRAAANDPHRGSIVMPGRVVIDAITALASAGWLLTHHHLPSVVSEILGQCDDSAVVDIKCDQHLTTPSSHHVHPHQQRHEQPPATPLSQAELMGVAHHTLTQCRSVQALVAHCQLIPFLIERSALTGVTLDRVAGSVAAFTHLYLPRLHRCGYVAPNTPIDGGKASPGGYVMDSQPGLYRHVLVLDFKSLYPSIIRTFCIDPMGLIEGLQQPEQAISGFRGALFSRTQHILPDLIASLWQARDQAKAAANPTLAQAIKLIMNACYGVLGSAGCRFYDPRLASSITLRGHSIMQLSRRWIEALGYQVIYGDTDSIFVHVERSLDPTTAATLGHELATQITQRWRDHIATEFGQPSYLELEYDTHYQRFLMPTIRGQTQGSKKRYAGLVGEGSAERLVFKGLESVRADWTMLAKQFQTGLYERVFHDRDPSDYIRAMVAQTLAGELDNQLIYHRRLHQPLAEYQQLVPPHVRAARAADTESIRRGLPPRYQHKGTISYVMTVAGPEPLAYRHSAIDYQHYITKQLKPIADAILPFIGDSFERICGQQLDLF